VVEDLAPPAAFTIGVARHLEAYCIDLNAASTHYLNAIGEENAMLYNSVEGDVTHVNHSGQTLFGNMVSLMIRGLGNGELGTWTTPDEEIVKAIEKGCFILPE
jgi:tRNA G37 N-methylase Trm5